MKNITAVAMEARPVRPVTEILEEAEKYIWRIKEEMRCA